MLHSASDRSRGDGELAEPDQRQARLQRRISKNRAGVVAGVVVVMLAFSCAVVAIAVSRNRPLFVLDEVAYADYLIKIGRGELWMPRGDVYSQEGMRVTLCRGVASPEEGVPLLVQSGDCERRQRNTAEFANGGVNTAATHPPTYFLITYVGARVIIATGLTSDLVTGGRLFGAVWMASGLLALSLLAREMGARPLGVAVLVGVVGLSAKFVEEWQYLTPDAANFLVGASVALVAVRWVRRLLPTWSLPVAGLGAVAIKAPNLLIVGAAGLGILLAEHGRRPLKERVLGTVALGGGMTVGVVAITTVTTVLSDAGSASLQDKNQYADSLGIDHFLRNVMPFLGAIGRDSSSVQLSHVVFLFLVSFLVAAAFGLPKQDVRQPFSSALLVAFVFGPAALVTMVFLAQHQYFPVEARYGYSLLPPTFAVAASYWTTNARLIVVSVLFLPYLILSIQSLLS